MHEGPYEFVPQDRKLVKVKSKAGKMRAFDINGVKPFNVEKALFSSVREALGPCSLTSSEAALFADSNPNPGDIANICKAEIFKEGKNPRFKKKS